MRLAILSATLLAFGSACHSNNVFLPVEIPDWGEVLFPDGPRISVNNGRVRPHTEYNVQLFAFSLAGSCTYITSEPYSETGAVPHYKTEGGEVTVWCHWWRGRSGNDNEPYSIYVYLIEDVDIGYNNNVYRQIGPVAELVVPPLVGNANEAYSTTTFLMPTPTDRHGPKWKVLVGDLGGHDANAFFLWTELHYQYRTEVTSFSTPAATSFPWLASVRSGDEVQFNVSVDCPFGEPGGTIPVTTSGFWHGPSTVNFTAGSSAATFSGSFVYSPIEIEPFRRYAFTSISVADKTIIVAVEGIPGS